MPERQTSAANCFCGVCNSLFHSCEIHLFCHVMHFLRNENNHSLVNLGQTYKVDNVYELWQKSIRLSFVCLQFFSRVMF